MLITIATLHVMFLAVSAVLTGGLALYAWRHRLEPGALSFGGLMLAVTVWTAGYAIGLVTLHPRWRLFWENIPWFGIVFVPVFFFLFTLEYTGYDKFVSRKTVALLSIHPLVTVLLVWTNPRHGFVWTETRVVVVDGIAFAVQEFGPWFWVNLLYTYGLIAVGSFLLLRLVFRSDYLYMDQSILLLVGVVAPLLGNAVSIFGPTPYPGIDLVPYALTVTGLAFGYAMFRYRLFELLPATRQIGRKAAISDLEDGVLIIDTQQQIVHLNPAAADIFDCEPADVLGQLVRSIIPTGGLDFTTEDTQAEFELSGQTFELRSSPIYDQHDRQLGTTLIVQDITNRKQRELMLERQRDELETLNQINTVIRGVNQALVEATTHDEIDHTVCKQLASSDLYQAVWVGRGLLVKDEPIRWTAAIDERPESGSDGNDPTQSPPPPPVRFDTTARELISTLDAKILLEQEHGAWTTVPLVYNRTIYGVLVLFTDRTGAFTDRELETLDKLGETVGLAINAVENQKLLLSETVVELELVCTDSGSVFVEASAQEQCAFTLVGLVPAAKRRLLVYQVVEGISSDRVCELASDALGITNVRTLTERENGGLLEFTLSGGSVLGPLTDLGTNITSARAESGECHLVAEVAPDADVRAVLEQVKREFPDTRLLVKRERDHPVENIDPFPDDTLETLTERQRQAIEAAYFGGYFEWPRESTGEEVAESMDISAPTFYNHLRKAQNRILAELLDEKLNGED